MAAATISNWTLIAATLLVVSTLLGRVYARAYLGELGLREDEIGLNDQSLVEMVRSGAGLFLGFTLYVALATAGISAILLGPVLVVIEVVHRVFANRWWTFGSMVRNRGVRLIVSLLLAGVVAFMSLIVVAGPKSAASDVAIGRLEQDSFSSWTFWFMFPHKPRCVVLVGPDETMNTESDSGPPLVWLGDHDGYTTLLRASDGAGRPKIARVPSGSFALVAQADEPCR